MYDPKEALTPLGQMTPKSTCLPRSHPGLQTALGISAWTSKYNLSLGEGQTLGVFLAGKGDLLPEGHFPESGLGWAHVGSRPFPGLELEEHLFLPEHGFPCTSCPCLRKPWSLPWCCPP